MLGEIGGRRRRGQRMRWLNGIMDSRDMNLSKLQERVKDREAWRVEVRGIAESRTPLSEWTAAVFASLGCRVTQLYTCVYLLFYKFLSHLGYYTVLSRVPCAIQ